MRIPRQREHSSEVTFMYIALHTTQRLNVLIYYENIYGKKHNIRRYHIYKT